MKKHSRFMRWLKRLIVALAIIALVLLLAVWVQSMIATQKLKSITARLKQESIPTSWTELYAQYPKVEEHLVAQSNLFAALAALADIPDLSHDERKKLPVEGSAELPELGSNLPPQMMSALDVRLNNVAPALADVREAVTHDPFWLVVPTNTCDMPNLPRLGTFRQAARLFYMSAIVHSERGEGHEAAKAVVDGIRLSQVPHRGGLLISELVRFACEGVAVQSIEYTLAKNDPSPEVLLEMASLLSEHNDMRTGLFGEFVYVKQMYQSSYDISTSQFRNMLKCCDAQPWQCLITYLGASDGWFRMNEVYQLQLLLSVVQAWKLPWAEFSQQYEDACATIPRFYFLANMSRDTFSKVKIRELRATGAWRCARIAIAIELYSQKHNALPESLEELIPQFLSAIPVEPFHGKPFTYEREGNSAILRFSYPDSKESFRFQVFASKGVTEPKN